MRNHDCHSCNDFDPLDLALWKPVSILKHTSMRVNKFPFLLVIFWVKILLYISVPSPPYSPPPLPSSSIFLIPSSSPLPKATYIFTCSGFYSFHLLRNFVTSNHSIITYISCLQMMPFYYVFFLLYANTYNSMT